MAKVRQGATKVSGNKRRLAEKPKKSKLSLYPLAFDEALGAALRTGKPEDQKAKRPVDNSRKS
jgi:hypothetical protein